MNNILERAKKDLKSYAKQNKKITFSIASAVSLLMNGTIANADDIETTKKTIDSTVDSINTNIKILRRSNDKLLKDRSLELVQLEEQGDQVIKSPWESWQFGVGFNYVGYGFEAESQYDGRGNKVNNRIFGRGAFTEKYTRNKANGNIAPVDLDLDSTYEEVSTTMITAGIKPKSVNKQAPNINLPVIQAPADPVINIALASPEPIKYPNVTPPNINVPSLSPNANPFSDFTWGWIMEYITAVTEGSPVQATETRKIPLGTPSGIGGSGGVGIYHRTSSVYALMDNIDITGGTFWSGYNPASTATDKKEDIAGYIGATQSSTGIYNIASGFVTSLNFDVRHLSIINSWDGRWSGKPGNKITGGTYHVAGGIKNNYYEAEGTEVFHLVGDVHIENVTANLYGKAAFINNEAFRGGRTTMKDVNINVLEDNNTIFNLKGAGPEQDKFGFLGNQYKTLFEGNANITINTRNNTIYAVRKFAGGLGINNTGKIILNGSSNIGASFLTWVPDKSKYKSGATLGSPFAGYTSAGTAGEGNVDAYKPSITFDSNNSVEMNGDENVGVFFNRSEGNYNVGIHQGYFNLFFDIGTKDPTLLSKANITGYSTSDVDTNIAVFAISGQRTGVDSVALGGNTPGAEFSKDPTHNLIMDNFKIKFGSYSKNGFMFLAKNGTVIEVNNKSVPAGTLGATFSDGINDSATIESDSSIGTVIAYAEGTWTATSTGLTALPGSGIEAKPTEIIINRPLDMVSKEGVAFFANEGGKVTMNDEVKGYGYRSLIGYAKDDGTVEIDKDITAIDAGVSTTNKKYINIGAYAKDTNGPGALPVLTPTTVTIKGNATINGIAAIAEGDGAVINLNGTGNIINTGVQGGLYAVDKGVVNFSGGTIVNKDNGTILGQNDHDNVAPFYATKSTTGTGDGIIKFTGATTIEMHDGVLVVGKESDYSSLTGTTSKYQGMGNVSIDLKKDWVNLGVFSGINNITVGAASTPLTWGPNYLVQISTIPKFNVVNDNGFKYKSILTEGSLLVSQHVDLSMETSPGSGILLDGFNHIIMERELVTIDTGINVISTNGKGLSMGSNDSTTGPTGAPSNIHSGYINKGTVNISGGTVTNSAVGINVVYGQIHNDTTGIVTVDNGAGLYGTNGSKIINDGIINVTGSGQGIVAFGKSPIAPALPITYGNNSINIENKGTINVASINATGIYANNNDGALQSDVNITNTKNIELLGDKSVGIALVGGAGGTINATGNGGTDIKVSTNGVGIYGENTIINLTNPYKIETKDGGVGIFLSKNSTLNGTQLNYDYTGGTSGLGVAMVQKISSGAATNNLDITLNNITQTTGGMIGIFANDGGTLTNNGDITGTSPTTEFGIVVENNGTTPTNIINSGNITLASATNMLNTNVGIYVKPSTTTPVTLNSVLNSGTMTLGNNTVGIYGYAVDNTLGTITTGNNSVGIFTQGGNVTSGKITVGNSESVAIFANGDSQNITINDFIIMGDTSYGLVNRGTNSTIVSNIPGVNLSNDNVYIYSNDARGNLTNNTSITSSGDRNYGLYASGNLVNNANINMDSGLGNVGIYSLGTAINSPGVTINVGRSDSRTSDYSIGMAAGYIDPVTRTVTPGTVKNNNGVINVYKDGGIGMYANGIGSKAENWGDINLSGKNTIGMYVDNGAVAENHGIIKALPNLTNDGITGMVALNGATIKNYGQIIIDGNDGVGMYNSSNATSNPNANGTATITATNGATATATQTQTAAPTSKSVNGVGIIAPPNGPVTITRATGIVTPTFIDTNVASPLPVSSILVGSTQISLPNILVPNSPTNASVSSIGMYIDTSGINYTNPISGLANLTSLKEVNLLVGTEATKYTNDQDIEIGANILAPYNLELATISGRSVAINTSSANLLWIATPLLDSSQSKIERLYLSKIPFSSFAKDKSTKSFMDSMDEKYKTATGTDKTIFNKLNDLGKGEANILAQAIDQLRGNQYATNQLRIYKTSETLDRGFDDLFDWQTKSKDSNKIKLIGGTSTYRTDTAGIEDYNNTNTGVVYLREDETMNLGRSQGWYTGLLYDRYKFKDLASSTEDAVTAKLGLYKSIPFDSNNTLNWTIKGDISGGVRQMHRKMWIVDEVFDAQGTYYTYGTSVENELSKTIRLSKGWSFKPYGALDAEYGRYTKIKENKGAMNLELKSGDYYSIKPSLGAELIYNSKFLRFGTFKLSLGGKYEYELGKIGEADNKSRLKETNSNYSMLAKEKELNGNGLFDLNMGIENGKLGFTLGGTYNTSGEVTGSTGLRWIF